MFTVRMINIKSSCLACTCPLCN